MRNLFLTAAIALTGAAITACSSTDEIISGSGTDTPQTAQGEQVITIGVAGSGSGFTTRAGALAERKLRSAISAQRINNVKVVIVKATKKAGITGKDNYVTSWQPAEANATQFTCYATTTFDDWMATSTGVGTGNRRQEWKIGKGTLPAGHYLAYAIGSQATNTTTETGKFNTIEAKDDAKSKTGLITEQFPCNPERGRTGYSLGANQITYPGEIFAGMVDFEVGASGDISVTLNLHRQVAGALGYFKNIPRWGDEQAKQDNGGTNIEGAYLRLVSANCSNGMLCGAFNSGFTTTNNDVQYIMNGYHRSTPNTGAAAFAAPTADTNVKFRDGTGAFVVYEAKISDWFTGTAHNGDTNDDGTFNEDDLTKDAQGNVTAGWTNHCANDGYTEDNGTQHKVTVQPGTILAGEFAFPFERLADHETLELQLLSSNGTIIRNWKVVLPENDSNSSQIGKNAIAVNFDATTSQYSFVQATKAEEKDKFSFLRNHIYCLGKRMKTTYDPDGPTPGPDPDPDPDDPIDLTKASVLVMVHGPWEEIHQMELE